MRMRPQH